MHRMRRCFSLRSGRERKAWGVSPRKLKFDTQARVSGRKTREKIEAVARYCGLRIVIRKSPGADAPGFRLTPASQAETGRNC
jgi:hypothetical protein